MCKPCFNCGATEITVICQALDLRLLSFISSLGKDKIHVQYILISPHSEIHPKRLKQRRIRDQLFDGRIKLNQKIRTVFVNILSILGVKGLIVRGIYFIFSLFNKFRIIYLDNDWKSNDEDCFNNITIIYSLEGLLSFENISSFIEKTRARFFNYNIKY